jgi:branched-chain amino acid transport system ATP-binding protein
VLAGAHLYGRGGLIAAVFGKLVIGSEERRLSDRAYEMIRFVGLGDRANVPASELPAGQGRLLELARALAPNPDLLLLDEPASGLTSSERATLERKLRELQMSGKTIILVDHDMRLVMNLADRVVVLNEGRVLAGGTPSDVQASPSVIDVYLGRRRANPRNAVATDRTGGQS